MKTTWGIQGSGIELHRARITAQHRARIEEQDEFLRANRAKRRHAADNRVRARAFARPVPSSASRITNSAQTCCPGCGAIRMSASPRQVDSDLIAQLQAFRRRGVQCSIR
jgi:hypothetical protein